MPRIETRRPQQLAYRQRFSRPMRWLGCIGLIVGLLVIVSPWGHRSRPGSHSLVIAAGGFLLTLVGIGLVWGRRGKLFDREAGTITFWWGAPWAFARTSYELAGFQSLVVAPYEQRGEQRWQIALLTAEGERLDLFDLTDAVAAQRAAQEIGQFLELTIQAIPASVASEDQAT